MQRAALVFRQSMADFVRRHPPSQPSPTREEGAYRVWVLVFTSPASTLAMERPASYLLLMPYDAPTPSDETLDPYSARVAHAFETVGPAVVHIHAQGQQTGI